VVPDTRMRLGAVMKALDDIIAPAISADKKYALEQLALIQKSIALIQNQIIHEYSFLIRDAMDYLELANSIISLLPEDETIRANLRQEIIKIEEQLPKVIPDRETDEKNIRLFKAYMENTVEQLMSKTELSNYQQLFDVILSHSEKQTTRDRVWTLATGFDPAPETLPSMKESIYHK